MRALTLHYVIHGLIGTTLQVSNYARVLVGNRAPQWLFCELSTFALGCSFQWQPVFVIQAVRVQYYMELQFEL